MSIDATHVVYSIERANLSGTRWEVSLGGIRVDATTPALALAVVAEALCRPGPDAMVVTYPKRAPDQLREVVESMAAARMSPEWIAGALWADSWLRGEVD